MVCFATLLLVIYFIIALLFTVHFIVFSLIAFLLLAGYIVLQTII